MIKVYLLSVTRLFEETIYEAACKKLDAGRLEKVNQAKRAEDKILRVGAGLLLQYAVKTSPVFDCRPDMVSGGESPCCEEVSMDEVLSGIREPIEFDFCYGPHGKPYFKEKYLKEKCDLFFSLSHSGEYVLCALSDVEIGADIQKIPDSSPEKIKREESIAGKFFSKPEKIWYQQGKESEQRQRFYRIWAAKEAYMKLTGKGLTEGFSTFSVDAEKEIVTDETGSGPKAAIYEIDAPKGYTAAVSIKI